MTQHLTLITRLKAAMDDRQLNARELAEKAGVGASFVYDILHGKSRSPTVEKLAAVAAVLGTNVQYLLTGETPAEQSGLVAIASLAVMIRSGGLPTLTTKTASSDWRFHRQWLVQELGCQPEQLRAVETQDDSMEPTLREGDMLLVNVEADTTAPLGIYVLLDALGLTVRRLTPTASGAILMEADNAHFPVETLPLASLNIIGKVVWSARKF